MPLAALHAFSTSQQSSLLVLSPATPATGVEARPRGARAFRLHLELQRGWVHALTVEPYPREPRPPHALPRRPSERAAEEQSLLAGIFSAWPGSPGLTRGASAPARLSALLVEAVHGAHRLGPVIDDGADGPVWRSGVTPFHPLAALRTSIDALFGPAGPTRDDRLARADRLIDAGGRRQLGLRTALHPSGLDPDEQVAVQLLASPRSWDELLTRSRCPLPRLLRLVRDAAILGALFADGEELSGPLLALLVASADSPGEDEATRRRAYHAQARALHPDLHPADDPETRKARTDAMAELAARRRRGD